MPQTLMSMLIKDLVPLTKENGYKCIYSKSRYNLLTNKKPTDMYDSALPTEISGGTNYIITNPFGINTPVITILEIYYPETKLWVHPGYCTTPDSSITYMCYASHVDTKGICIATGGRCLTSYPGVLGNPLIEGWEPYTAEARVHVYL